MALERKDEFSWRYTIRDSHVVRHALSASCIRFRVTVPSCVLISAVNDVTRLSPIFLLNARRHPVNVPLRVGYKRSVR